MQIQQSTAAQRAQMKQNGANPDTPDRSTESSDPAKSNASKASSAEQLMSTRLLENLAELEALLGERILPLVPAETQPEPWLTALDSRSALLVIELFDVLDAATLTRALASAGRWSRFSRTELAQFYPGGAEQFSAALTQFLSSVPREAGASAGQRTRLIILCAEVAAETADAVRFLRHTGSAIEVRASLPRTPARSLLESEPIPVAPMPPETVAPPRASFPGRGRSHNPGARALPTATGSSVHAAAHDGPRLRSRLVRDEATDTNQMDLSRTRRAQSGDRYAAAMAYGTPDVPVASTTPAIGVGPSGPTSERLVALAAQLTEPTTLVWTRLRRGQRFEATLHTDGVITLADGGAYTDPDTAAAAAAGTESYIDGWRIWRIGDDGPALAELG